MDYSIQKTGAARQSNLLVAKGVLAIAWGVAALLGAIINPMALVFTFGLLNIAAAMFTLAYAYSNRHLKIAHQWLLLEGMVELIAGIVFAFVVRSVPQFIEYMSYGIIFIITLQFIYGYTLLLKNVVNPKNMAARFVSVILGTVISVGLLAHVFSLTLSFVLIGIFSIFYGLLNMQFAVKLRNVILGKTE